MNAITHYNKLDLNCDLKYDWTIISHLHIVNIKITCIYVLYKNHIQVRIHKSLFCLTGQKATKRLLNGSYSCKTSFAHYHLLLYNTVRTEQLPFQRYIVHSTIRTNQSSGMRHLQSIMQGICLLSPINSRQAFSAATSCVIKMLMVNASDVDHVSKVFMLPYMPPLAKMGDKHLSP